MPGPINGVALADGSMDWSGGVDSIRSTTIQSPQTPNGLARNQLAWLDNATVRDGGISPRGGYSLVGQVHDANGLFQGKFMYEPGTSTNPYELWAISGNIYKVVVSPSFSVTNLSAQFHLTLPPTLDQYFFVQAEQFVVIQAGDFTTLPLFWDGTTLRRSKGITNKAVAPGTPGVNEIPAAGPMDYFMGRLWYAIGRQVNAGDIVGGNSGTVAYQFTDAVLNVTENPLVLGGDGFTVPTQSGNIRAVFHNANLNTSLGQGNLFVGTRRAVYSLNVPVTRADWIAATNSNQPLMTVVQLVNGPVNDRSVTQVNGDVYYQSLEPAVRSLLSAVRYFNQPGNIQISAQENRILQFNDRSLMRFASGVEFGSRLFQTALPKQLPQGVIHQAMMPLDFLPMSSFGSNQNPVWEGMNEGLQILQFATGDFGGLQRTFAAVVSGIDSVFELWELSEFNQFDDNRTDSNARIQWYAEFPSFTWGDEFALKKLVSADLWVDRIYGTVIFQLDYQPDGEACWLPWHQWQVCSARNSCEDVNNPICYPITPYGEGYRSMMSMPRPPTVCERGNQRPSNIGYQFQVRLRVKGYCRVRGLILYAEQLDRQLYQNLVCGGPFTCAPAAATTQGNRPVPIPPAPGTLPPVPTPTFYTVQGWSSLVNQLVGAGACDASILPAWDGSFPLATTWNAGAPLWYFTGASIGGRSVSADEAPHYPNGNWQAFDTPTQLYWDPIALAWFVWIVCNNGTELWLGKGSTTLSNPLGVYTYQSGTTPGIATVTLVLA